MQKLIFLIPQSPDATEHLEYSFIWNRYFRCGFNFRWVSMSWVGGCGDVGYEEARKRNERVWTMKIKEDGVRWAITTTTP